MDGITNGHATLESKESVIELLNDLELKSTVAHPGSRGGTYYIDDKGIVRYGTKPPPKAPKAKKGHAAAKGRKGPDPAKAAAHQAALEMRQAKGNAQNEIRDITSLADAQKLGYTAVGGASGDVAALNQAARDAGAKDPSKVYAVVKVGNGYQVIAKPMSALKGDRSNVMTQNAGATTAAAQHQAQQESARIQREQEQTAKLAVRNQQRAQAQTATQQRQAARDAARQQRQAQRDAASAAKRTRGKSVEEWILLKARELVQNSKEEDDE